MSETIRQLAKMLDDRFEKIDDFRGRKCMRELSPILRTLLQGKSVETSELLKLLIHTKSHSESLLHQGESADDLTWGGFYNAMTWNAFGALVALVLPEPYARHLDSKKKKKCLWHLAHSIIMLDDAIDYPELYHLNNELDAACLDDSDGGHAVRNLLAMTVEGRATSLLRSLGAKGF